MVELNPLTGLKPWGKFELLGYTELIHVNRGGKCSIHYHEYNTNIFIVKSGWLSVTVYEDKLKTHILKPGERLVVHPKIIHQFSALTDVVAVEEYKGPCGKEDIVRMSSWPLRTKS